MQRCLSFGVYLFEPLPDGQKNTVTEKLASLFISLLFLKNVFIYLSK